MNMMSAIFTMIPGLPVIFCFPVSELVKTCNHKDICMNCRYFHQEEDWRETPEGFECRNKPSADDDFPKVNGGQHCSNFLRKPAGGAMPPWKIARLEHGKDNADGAMPGGMQCVWENA